MTTKVDQSGALYEVAFEIAGLPRMTNPKSGGSRHWRALHREASTWKMAVSKIIGAKKPATPLERARLVLTRFSSVAPDPDGLVSGFKHVIDGLVQCGVLSNDRYDNIGMPDYRWQKVPPKAGRIRVEVRGVSSENAAQVSTSII